MPSFEFTSPDGQKYTVAGPDGATKEQAFGILQGQIKSGSAKADAAPKPEPELGVGDAAKAMGEAALNAGTGMIAKPVSDIAGLAATAKEAISPTPGRTGAEPSGFAQELRDKLTYSPRTELGKQIAEKGPLARLSQGVDWVGDKEEKLVNAVSPFPEQATQAWGRAAHEAINQLPGMLGAKSVGKLAERPPTGFAPPEGQIAPPPVKPVVDPKMAILQQAREAGLKVKPSQVSDGPINTFLQGLAGDAKTHQLAASKNQAPAQALARKALDLPEDTPLNEYTFAKYRAGESKNYSAVSDIGTIKASEAYSKAMDSIAGEDKSANQAFPKGGESEIAKMVETLREPTFEASGAIAKIKQLRTQADKSFRTGDTGLGRAQKQAALALEDELDRAATEKYGPDNEIVQGFRDARKNIAKSYAVQAATGPGGTISMAKFGQALKKGKLLTGELKLMGEFANTFGKSAANNLDAPPNFSFVDAAVGGIPALAHGNPSFLAAATGRPLLRQALTSDWYQNRLAAPPGAGMSVPPGVGAGLLAAPPQRQ